MINKKIKKFKLKSYHEGDFGEVTHKDLKGKWSVLFFYPADFTFVCPTELEDLSDHYEKFKELGVEVYSVSTDTHFSHKAWHDTSDRIKKIKFPMLGDPTAKLVKQLGIYIAEEGISYRGTFVINPEGRIKIVEINDNGIGRSASELLRKIEAAKYVEENDGEVCPAKWTKGGDVETLKPKIDLVGVL